MQSRVIKGAKAILETRGYSDIKVVEEDEHLDVFGSRKDPETKEEESIVVRIPEKDILSPKPRAALASLVLPVKQCITPPREERPIFLMLLKSTSKASRQ